MNFYRAISTTLIAIFVFNSTTHTMHIAKKRPPVTKIVRHPKPRTMQYSTCFSDLYCRHCTLTASNKKNPDSFRKDLEESCCNPQKPIKELLPTLVLDGDAPRVAVALTFELPEYFIPARYYDALISRAKEQEKTCKILYNTGSNQWRDYDKKAESYHTIAEQLKQAKIRNTTSDL